MNNASMALAALLLAGAATTAVAQVRIFEHDGFAGRSISIDRPVQTLDRYGFNDQASSVVVRGGLWEFCDDARFRGHCVTLRPGRYPSLSARGLNDRVSSVRPAPPPRRPPPPPRPY